jgi:AraC-like DNA-binding protein
MRRAVEEEDPTFPEKDREERAVSAFPEKDRELGRLLIQAARVEIHGDSKKARSRHYKVFLLHIGNNLMNPNLDVNAARNAARLMSSSMYAIEFSRIVGMNPAVYIEHQRMELARRLLQHTQASVACIAFAVGYENANYFSNRYLKFVGHRPTIEPKADSQSAARLLANLGRLVQPNPLTTCQTSESTPGVDQKPDGIMSVKHLWNSISSLDEEQAFAYILENIHSSDISHFNFLLEKSKLEGRKSRKRGEVLAGIALDMLRAIELSKRSEFIDEKIRGYINLGNARRLIFDLIGSREAFRVVDDLMPTRSTRGLLFLEATFFKALLLWWERDVDSALGLIEEIIPDLKAHASCELLTRALQLSGMLYDCKGSAEKALRMFEEAVKSTEGVIDPYVCLSAHYHLSFMYAKLSHGKRASELFEKVLSLHSDAATGDSEYQIVLLKAAILRANGELRAAEIAFLEAREGFRSLGADIYVALIALELALLYLELKEPSQAFSMATSAISCVSQYSAHKEAIAALAILEEASHSDAMNRSVIAQALHHLERVRKDPTHTFLAQ